MAVAHLALQLGAGHERGDAVDHDHVHSARAHERVRDLQPLFAAVGLAEKEIIEVHAELAGVCRVERVLGVNEGAGAAALLGLRDRMQRERRLAGTLGAVNLDDATTR